MNKIITREFKEAVSEGVFSAADLVVAKSGEVVFGECFGDARIETCFDIASLTKPVCTAALAMMLLEEDRLKTSDTIYQWLAGARKPEHKLMEVIHLANHTSGLPAWQPYYRELPIGLIGTNVGKRMILDSCFEESLISKPGEKTIYSDLGYILLGEIVSQAGGAPLDELFEKKIAAPLGLKDTFFIKVTEKPVSITTRRTTNTADKHVPTPKHGLLSERPKRHGMEHRRFAPTEDCPWRERVVHGEVHDQNAYALGGVAGHSGLFSTSLDLHRFTLELTRAYSGSSTWISPELVRSLVGEGKIKPVGDEFSFGWNRPSRRNSSSGRHFSANTIGHLGYTGCSIWIDLEKDFWIILLTNRIHPSSTNQKIKLFRPRIHDLIYDELLRGRL